MLPLHLKLAEEQAPSVLVIGAHPDDIEIGAGGTLLSLADAWPGLQARYLVLTGTEERHLEARAAATAFLPAADLTIELHHLPEGRLPTVWDRVKDILEEVAHVWTPDLIPRPRALTPIKITGRLERWCRPSFETSSPCHTKSPSGTVISAIRRCTFR